MTGKIIIRKVENGYVVEYDFYLVSKERIFATFDELELFLRQYFDEPRMKYRPVKTKPPQEQEKQP